VPRPQVQHESNYMPVVALRLPLKDSGPAPQSTQNKELASLLLTNVQVCGMVARVISNKLSSPPDGIERTTGLEGAAGCQFGLRKSLRING